MKAIFKGYLSFGLVTIPVRLYSAVEPKQFQFKLLHAKDNRPLHYKRWCEKCNKEVKWEDVVRGIEYEKNRFLPFPKATLERLKPEKSEYIEIIEFVEMRALDPIYFNKHYFAVPEGEKEKAYWLFKEVLSATAKVAIGRMILHDKEHIVAIESYKKGLLLTTLNYAYEIRDINKLEELKIVPKLTAQELSLAKELMKKLCREEFKIEQFKDTFAEQLKPLIQRVLKGEKIIAKKPKPPKLTLMQALKASI